MDKYNNIIFLTTNYPYDNGETFIDNEIDVIRKYCHKLIIVPMNNSSDKTNGRIGDRENTKLIRLKIGILDYWIELFRCIFSEKVRDEIINLIYKRKFSIYTFASVVYSFCKGEIRIRKIKKVIKEELEGKNNLIYSYWNGTTAYVAAGLKETYRKTRCVTRAHGYDIYQEVLHPYYIPFKDSTFKLIDEIFSVSKCGCDYLKKHFPNVSYKISTSYLGTEDFGLNPNARNGLFKIVSCSNVVLEKRIDRIITALEKIDKEIIWEHYGDGELMDKTLSMAKSLPKNIHYKFMGHIDNKTLMKIYSCKHIDVFINVSESEGLPVSIMEAISFGIPIIATDVGGNKEIVCEGVNGYLLQGGCLTEKLRDTIERMIDLPEKDMRSLRLNARLVWEEKFMASKNYDAFFQHQLSNEIKG